MLHYTWSDYAGKHFNFGRTNIAGYPLHDHDFPEVFWIEEGRAIHQINGRRELLNAGALVMMRPWDVHGFSAGAEGNFTICNVAVEPGLWRELLDRCYPQDAGFWSGEQPLPWGTELSARQLQRLGREFQELSRGPRQRRDIERFLLNVIHTVHGAQGELALSELPAWLARACREIAEPRHFQGGTQAFARLAGRCPEHVSRELRRLTGRSPTDLVNQARLNYAASELLVTDKTILQIALDCGYQSLGHFYKAFKEAHGATPRAYRQRNALV